MKNIFLFFLKKLKIQLKYRFVWVNRLLTPFSMMAPFVFIFKIADNSLEGFAVIGVIVWYWVNQFFLELEAPLMMKDRKEL